MAKQSGLAQKLIVGAFDVSGDIGGLTNVHGGPAFQDVTGIDKSGHERIGTERDGSMEYIAFFNNAVGQAHAVFSALPRTDVMNTYMTGQLQGAACACMIGKQNNYDPKRTNAAELTIDIKMAANGFGLEWGRSITAGLRTDAGATSPATGLDNTDVSTLFGWQAYLQVTALTGTNVIVTLQDSADNAAFANLTGGAFTSVTAVPATQRLTGGPTDTVRRYIRAITTGTFSSATFTLVFIRNYTAVTF